MMMPARSRYLKSQRGKMRGTALKGTALNFGDFGLKALENTWVTDRQIEAARVTITRNMKRTGKLWIRIFPDKPVSKKPAETRMGHGKSNPEYWVAVVKAGRIMFEVGGVTREVAKESMRLASHKLPLATKMVSRGGA